eukprot:TRINITY_DN3553_c0_g1_i5.p1 TRINITY_DN3553_c0_g1~~TRINITY_DN3553_c0_g1_i5.p1  ORF type:complete len:265 (+),score=25.69 TRINITY_DN3553_c0_g1_i5:101-796(+)
MCIRDRIRIEISSLILLIRMDKNPQKGTPSNFGLSINDGASTTNNNNNNDDYDMGFEYRFRPANMMGPPTSQTSFGYDQRHDATRNDDGSDSNPFGYSVRSRKTAAFPSQSSEANRSERTFGVNSVNKTTSEVSPARIERTYYFLPQNSFTIKQPIHGRIDLHQASLKDLPHLQCMIILMIRPQYERRNPSTQSQMWLLRKKRSHHSLECVCSCMVKKFRYSTSLWREEST